MTVAKDEQGKRQQRWDGQRRATLSPEKREQYERIEERVREKMAKGLL